jgi:hypothetical protein
LSGLAARAPAEPVTFRVGDVQDGAMTFDDLRAAVDLGTPLPDDAPVLVRALWHDATGDWDGAHRVAQDVETPEGAWVHAYLHRKEGDQSNAEYWYRRARIAPSVLTLDAEWEELVRRFLAQG